MKRLLVWLSLLVSFSTTSQNLLHSKTGTHFTAIYKVTNAEAIQLYEEPGSQVDEKLFHTLIGHFTSDSLRKLTLDFGHYLYVTTNEDKLNCELVSIDNLQIHVLNNHRDLHLVFTNQKGEEVIILNPRVGNKTIPFNSTLNLYQLQKTNRQGFVSATYENHTNIFEIKRMYNNTFTARARRRILYTFPMRQILGPFRYVYYNTKSFIQYRNVTPPAIYYKVKKLFEEKDYEGFVVLNKPKYKPGDTVKLKGYVTNKKGHPISKSLSVELSSYSYGRMNKKLGQIKPYRPGCYVFDFVLTDTLKLLLDQNYSLTFNDKRYNNYPLETFQFEEYELKQNEFSIRAITDKWSKDDPKIIFLKGTDINEMPLFDVGVEFSIYAKTVKAFYDQSVFIPDTMWRHDFKLEAIGETRLEIPDSIFKEASLELELVAQFRNAENEIQARNLKVYYDAKKPNYSSSLADDSIKFSGLGIIEGELVAYDKNLDEMNRQTITLPFQEKVNPYVSSYSLFVQDKIVKSLDLENEGDKLEVSAFRNKDTLVVDVHNPRKILFRYQLFNANHLMDKGYSDRYSFHASVNPADRYYLSVQYVWGGNEKEKNYDFPFAYKSISIDVNHPSTIYPGQSVPIEISVKDSFGNPVSNADVTAFSITKKFKSDLTIDLKQFEKIKSRKVFNAFSTKSLDEISINQKLNYDFWKSKLGLDSMAYYQFLYPTYKLFQYEALADDSITQIAPYVVKDGILQPVYYIYIDNNVVYFNQVNSIEPYSFAVPDDTFKIEIRLSDRLISLPFFFVPKGKKMILSFDLDYPPTGVQWKGMDSFYTNAERNALRGHFLWINRDPNQRFAYLVDGERYHMLDYSTGNTELIGPFYPGYIEYHTSNFGLKFDFKSDRLYTFTEDLIDRDYKDWPFRRVWNNIQVKPTFSDQVMNKKAILKNWKEYQNNTVYESKRNADFYIRRNRYGDGDLTIKPVDYAERVPRAIFILNLNDPDDYSIYPSRWRNFPKIDTGLYQVVAIYSDETYIKAKPVRIKSFGRTYYDFKNDSLRGPDSFSRDVMEKIFLWTIHNSYEEHARELELQEIRKRFYQESSVDDELTGGRWVTGTITAEEDGSPLPGVNIVVKGTVRGTVTDVEGRYRLYVPYGGVLVISFIGFQTQEINSQSTVDVKLNSDVTQLSEVVVVGYGVQSSRQMLSMAVSNVTGYLSGRVAGVQVNGELVRTDSIMLRVRGASSFSPGASPLVVIDGVVMSVKDIDPSKVSAIEILNAQSASAIYGSRGSNGVILISTKPGISRSELLKTKLPYEKISIPEVSIEGSTLRKNFRDYAFWQPKLKTNEEGKVSFKATFPDDITAWDVNVIAIASQKRSAQKLSSIRSFKPLLAQLSMPKFLIEGDKSIAIGKITNYSPDSLSLTRSISLNNGKPNDAQYNLANSKIDTIALVAEGDSLSVKYAVRYKAYEDGELRKIPILKKGTNEAKGIFMTIPSDSTFHLDFSEVKAPITMHIEADILDVLLEEVNQIKIYPYDCNEQTASKLRAYLTEKSVRDFRKEKFGDDKQVGKAIKKLIANQNEDGGWGWWENGTSSDWISMHVAGALLWAQRSGYKIRFDEEGLRRYLTPKDLNGNAASVLKHLIFLSQQGEKILAKGIVDSLAQHKKLIGEYDSLLAQRLLQLNHLPVDWPFIMKNRKTTLHGNWYWGKSSYTLWNNDIDNTLLVYQMLEYENPNDPNLIKLRNYFIERRKLSWRNTYESSRIIEVLMPGLLRAKENWDGLEVRIAGGIDETVTKFPYTSTFTSVPTFTIYKKSDVPVYFTAYYRDWNENPEKVEQEFKVRSRWGDGVDLLKAGKENKLEVDVHVEEDADYVMITIPIPAGCSYASKPQSRMYGEVHREYDVHETRIYCERMKAGNYHYSINLMPRYTGTYTLNPAKAEWMYFPVVFGRNEMSRVAIE